MYSRTASKNQVNFDKFVAIVAEHLNIVIYSLCMFALLWSRDPVAFLT